MLRLRVWAEPWPGRAGLFLSSICDGNNRPDLLPQDWYTDISFPFVPSVENFDGHNRPFMITPPLRVLRNKMAGLAAKTWVTGVTTHDGLPQALREFSALQM